jgi:RHS repeat-associated protein
MNNFTNFTYDGLRRCVKIVETTSGSVTSTRQFIWCGSQRCEERDGSGALTKQFFARGQRNGSTNYFYGCDHLGSVRTMTDNSGVSVSDRGFDPFGRLMSISESVAPDFGFAGMYVHTRSGLNLAMFRAYNPSLGIWLGRDPLGEDEGPNLYAYVGNNPAGNVDPLGLGKWGPNEWRNNALQHCIASCQLVKVVGKEIAKAIGDAWEAEGNKNGQTSASSQMDLNNNAVGREGPQCQNCGDYCHQKLREGKLYGPLDHGNRLLDPLPAGTGFPLIGSR